MSLEDENTELFVEKHFVALKKEIMNIYQDFAYPLIKWKKRDSCVYKEKLEKFEEKVRELIIKTPKGLNIHFKEKLTNMDDFEMSDLDKTILKILNGFQF